MWLRQDNSKSLMGAVVTLRKRLLGLHECSICGDNGKIVAAYLRALNVQVGALKPEVKDIFNITFEYVDKFCKEQSQTNYDQLIRHFHSNLNQKDESYQGIVDAINYADSQSRCIAPYTNIESFAHEIKRVLEKYINDCNHDYVNHWLFEAHIFNIMLKSKSKLTITQILNQLKLIVNESGTNVEIIPNYEHVLFGTFYEKFYKSYDYAEHIAISYLIEATKEFANVVCSVNKKIADTVVSLLWPGVTAWDSNLNKAMVDLVDKYQKISVEQFSKGLNFQYAHSYENKDPMEIVEAQIRQARGEGLNESLDEISIKFQ